jgi:hypothetical protein
MPFPSAQKLCIRFLDPSASPPPCWMSLSFAIIQLNDPYPLIMPPSKTMYVLLLVLILSVVTSSGSLTFPVVRNKFLFQSSTASTYALNDCWLVLCCSLALYCIACVFLQLGTLLRLLVLLSLVVGKWFDPFCGGIGLPCWLLHERGIWFRLLRVALLLRCQYTSSILVSFGIVLLSILKRAS